MNAVSSTQNLAARDRIPPVRGLLLTHDCRGRLIALTDLKKWLRLNVVAFKTEKNDVLLHPGGEARFEELLPAAGPAGCRLSLRCGPEISPEPLRRWRDLGLFDVFLCAYDAEDPGVEAWISACRALDIPLRLQITGPRAVRGHAERVAAGLRDAAFVNVALHDPFETRAIPARRRDAREAAAQMNLLARALRAQGTETYLLHLPFCLVDEDNLPHALNWQQFHLHHQHYGRAAYEWAQKMRRLAAHNVGKAVEMYLSRQISFHNLIDQRLLPWVLKQPWLFIRLWMLHKLTRHLNLLRHRPSPLPENVSAAEDAIAKLRAAEQRTLGPVCAGCRHRRICSHATEAFRRMLPGLGVQAESGETILDPLAMNAAAPRSYDSVDAARLHWSDRQQALVAHVWQLTADQPPTREILPSEIEIQDHCTFAMEGGIRWYSFANAELQSTVLARLQAPFTISFTVGGGFAALVGFSFGPHFRIVCPMIAPRHRITFSVDAEGHYVLLRDNEPVRPTEFEDSYYLPRKLAGVLEPRISLWNVDGQVVTQTVLLWEEAGNAQHRAAVKYSVVIISSCYSRRLQAVLLGLVHQQGMDLSEIEVIVAYVPGIDATDDLIDSLRLTHPELRIIRAPFPDARRRAKGFMINACADLAAGDWVVLLDSDIILPPDFFRKLACLPADCKFAAPDGRRMLTAEQTASILLGEIAPWTCYDELAENGPGEYRHHESMGAPPGFCQCVRRELFREHKYAEFDHFEGADWWFSVELVKRHGKETRFSGMKLLHLDHGGSQWYGTEKQM